ncbi:MAG: hypothetical protein H6R05_182 [Burkholderiaceae bacterium]|nr:hypothetical protein [Burkholderiaceae bacterium]
MGFAIVLQLIFAIIVTAICSLFGIKAMWSALAGSLIAILPNAIFAVYLFASPKPAAYRFFVGEGIKIVIALVVAVVFWRQYGMQVQPFAYWVALIVVLKAHNFSLLRTVKE